MQSFRKQGEGKEGNATGTKDMLGALSGMSEHELLGLLHREADKAKQQGTLNKSELEGFYSKMAPLLTAEQARKLRGLIDTL